MAPRLSSVGLRQLSSTFDRQRGLLPLWRKWRKDTTAGKPRLRAMRFFFWACVGGGKKKSAGTLPPPGGRESGRSHGGGDLARWPRRRSARPTRRGLDDGLGRVSRRRGARRNAHIRRRRAVCGAIIARAPKAGRGPWPGRRPPCSRRDFGREQRERIAPAESWFPPLGIPCLGGAKDGGVQGGKPAAGGGACARFPSALRARH